jgi:DNA polymerase-1
MPRVLGIWRRNVMRSLVLDVEGDGLLDTVTQLWCIVTKDVETGELKRWKYDNFRAFKEYLKQYDQLVGHNIIGYDLVVLLRFLDVHWPINPRSVLDTLILSLLSRYSRPGGHSLSAWGKTLGFAKDTFNAFSCYSDELMDRCEVDVELNYKVLRYLQTETAGQDLTRPLMLEYLTAQYMDKQEENGFALDVPKAHKLYCEVKGRRDTLYDTLQTEFPPVGVERVVTPHWKEDGDVSKVGLKSLGRVYMFAVADFCPVVYAPFNPGSPKQVLERLEGLWKPTEFTKPSRLNPDGQAKITEKNLATIISSAPQGAKKLGEYLMVKSRTKLINTWLEEEKNGRVHGKVWHIGAITHRMSHSNPNMANVPAKFGRDGSPTPYGAECRECWAVSDSSTHRLLGTDAKGIQLRVLAHYMEDPDYIEEVVNGDVHTRNQEALGIDSRDVAKTFIYAWVLGAGSGKVGSILGCSAGKGKKATDRFLDALPALRILKKRAGWAARLGYLVGLDGRRIEIKSEHYALSVYLQSGESIIMKTALHLWNKRSTHLHYKHVASIHDEWQTEVLKTEAEELGQIQCKAIRDAGTLLNSKCPMDGEFKIGLNWKETH